MPDVVFVLVHMCVFVGRDSAGATLLEQRCPPITVANLTAKSNR